MQVVDKLLGSIMGSAVDKVLAWNVVGGAGNKAMSLSRDEFTGTYSPMFKTTKSNRAYRDEIVTDISKLSGMNFNGTVKNDEASRVIFLKNKC
jgi:hypothetical protein